MAGEDPKHIRHLAELPCAWCGSETGGAPPHHSTASQPGMGRKAHDHEAMPMCVKCHRDFHSASGDFRSWTKRERREWQGRMVELFRPGGRFSAPEPDADDDGPSRP